MPDRAIISSVKRGRQYNEGDRAADEFRVGAFARRRQAALSSGVIERHYQSNFRSGQNHGKPTKPMNFNLLSPERVETAEEILRKPLRNGNDLFGLPYQWAMSLVYGVGFLAGTLVFRIVALGWCPTVAHGDPRQADVAYTLGSFGFVVVLIGTAIISAVAFFGNLDETWQRLGLLATAAGFMVFGVWAVAIHRIEIHPDRFVVRGPISPIAVTYSLTDGNKIVTRYQQKSPQTWFGSRRRQLRTFSVHYIRDDGSETVLHRGRWGPPTWSRVATRFEGEYVAK